MVRGKTTLGTRSRRTTLLRLRDYAWRENNHRYPTRSAVEGTRGTHVVRGLEQYNRSLVNLIKLVPMLTELKVYDNSKEADPNTGAAPQPVLILHSERGKIVSRCELSDVPQWAKPIVAAAM